MALFGTKKVEKKKEKKAAKPRRARAARLAPGEADHVIHAPWFSEKALLGTEKGVYVFAIEKDATSAEIAAAVKELYGVSPKAVRIVNVPGKVKALRTRRGVGKRAARRKAYVALNAGDTITLA